MALAPGEKQKRYRERQRAITEQRAREALKRAPVRSPYVHGSFAEFISGKSLLLHENLDAVGVIVDGDLDTDQQAFASQYFRDEPIDALQRATGLVGVFIDAATELSELINAFKLQEIERAIDNAIQASATLPQGDVQLMKQAFAEVERLKAIRTALRKPTRISLPTIYADGE
jgi:hypothetical protein